MLDFKQHMDDMWEAKEIDGKKVIERRLTYGALPDIRLCLEDGSLISGRERYDGQGEPGRHNPPREEPHSTPWFCVDCRGDSWHQNDAAFSQ